MCFEFPVDFIGRLRSPCASTETGGSGKAFHDLESLHALLQEQGCVIKQLTEELRQTKDELKTQSNELEKEKGQLEGLRAAVRDVMEIIDGFQRLMY